MIITLIECTQESQMIMWFMILLMMYIWRVNIYIKGQEKQMEMLTPSKPQINRQLIWLQVHFMFWKRWVSPCTCSREQFQFFSLLSNSTQLQPQDFCHTNFCLKLANLRYVTLNSQRVFVMHETCLIITLYTQECWNSLFLMEDLPETITLMDDITQDGLFLFQLCRCQFPTNICNVYQKIPKTK